MPSGRSWNPSSANTYIPGGFDPGQSARRLGGEKLVGTPQDVAEQIDQYRQAGVTTLAGLVFTASSAAEMNDAMVQFMTEVAPTIGN